jgi:hypothetical protein
VLAIGKLLSEIFKKVQRRELNILLISSASYTKCHGCSLNSNENFAAVSVFISLVSYFFE